MKIRFIGPLAKITGSCTWMCDEERGWNFLVDCGMQQSEPTAEDWNSCENWPFDPSKLQFVALTHAHIDHSGLLPVLYKKGFTGPVYCTTPTREIAKLLLHDIAKRDDAIFSHSDVESIVWKTKHEFNQYHPIDNDLFLRFYRSGHIVGAVSIAISWGAPNSTDQKSILFSGDIGPGQQDQEILPLIRFPMRATPCNFAVIESTYGATVRDDETNSPKFRLNNLKNFLDRIKETGGTLAIPAFSVGRTQDILFDLHRVVAEHPDLLDDIEFYLDSPLGEAINAITLQAIAGENSQQITTKVRPSWMGKQLFRDLELDPKNPDHIRKVYEICRMTLGAEVTDVPTRPQGNTICHNWLQIIRPLRDRKAHISNSATKPRVVIMSSGMGDGGPAAEWLPALLLSSRNIIAFSGFCSPGSTGGKLQRLSNVPVLERRLHNGVISWQKLGSSQQHLPISEIEADIRNLQGYSAHADQSDLVNWLFEEHRDFGRFSVAKTIFIQHGENRQRASLGDAILNKAKDWELDVDIVLPKESSAWFDLDKET